MAWCDWINVSGFAANYKDFVPTTDDDDDSYVYVLCQYGAVYACPRLCLVVCATCVCVRVYFHFEGFLWLATETDDVNAHCM